MSDPVFKEFLCSYNFEGAKWGFSIWAKDHGEAEQRLARIALGGKLDGELMMTLPAPVPLHPVIDALTWCRNAVRQILQQRQRADK